MHKAVPDATFARTLRCLQEALEADTPEEQLAQALCRCVEKAPGIAACALYLDRSLGGVQPRIGTLSAGPAGCCRLTAGDSAIGSLHVAISDPSQWGLYEPYAANAVHLVALRIENLRQALQAAGPPAGDGPRGYAPGPRTGTVRTNIERDARLSEERYRMLADNSADAVLQTTEDGSVLYANPAACRMFGREEAEIRRLGTSVLANPDDPAPAGGSRESAAEPATGAAS